MYFLSKWPWNDYEKFHDVKNTFILYDFSFHIHVLLDSCIYLSSYFPEVIESGSYGLKLFLQFCSLIISFTHHFPMLDLGMKLEREK